MMPTYFPEDINQRFSFSAVFFFLNHLHLQLVSVSFAAAFSTGGSSAARNYWLSALLDGVARPVVPPAPVAFPVAPRLLAAVP